MVGVQFWLAGEPTEYSTSAGSSPRSSSPPSQSLVGTAIASNSHHLESGATARIRRRRLNCRRPAFWRSERRRTKASRSLRAVVARAFSQDFDEVAARLRGDNHPGLAEQVQRHIAKPWACRNLPIGSMRSCQHSFKSTRPYSISRIMETIPTPSNRHRRAKRRISLLLSKYSTRRSTQASSALRRQSRRDRSMRQSMYSVVALGAVLICASIGAGIYPRLREYR